MRPLLELIAVPVSLIFAVVLLLVFPQRTGDPTWSQVATHVANLGFIYLVILHLREPTR